MLPREVCVVAHGRKHETEQRCCSRGDEASAHGEIEQQLIEVEGVHRAV